jgi:hypothetical protein
VQDSTASQQPLEEPSQGELDQIASLLFGEPDAQPEPSAETPPAEGETPAAEDPADGPEKDEPDAIDQPEKAEVDYGMLIPITGGEPVTLGELKDAWQNHQAAMLDVQDRENAVLRKTQDFEQLLSFLDQLPPAAIEIAEKRRKAMYAREMPKLAAAIPGFETAEGAREVIKVMAEAAKQYGISEDELGMVMDSRYIKWMYDAAKREKAIRDARNNVKPLRSATPQATPVAATHQSTLQRLTEKAKRTRSADDQTAAIDALIRSA